MYKKMTKSGHEVRWIAPTEKIGEAAFELSGVEWTGEYVKVESEIASDVNRIANQLEYISENSEDDFNDFNSQEHVEMRYKELREQENETEREEDEMNDESDEE